MVNSIITGRNVFGANPIGFVPLVPLNNGYLQFIGQSPIKLELPYSSLTFVLNDIPATQADFLAEVKSELDTNYFPSVFTDATKTYNVEISVNSVKLDFKTQTSDRGI
jgi:hypothetical protein